MRACEFLVSSHGQRGLWEENNERNQDTGSEWEETVMDRWAPRASRYMAGVVKQSFNSLYPDVKLKVWAEDEGVTATTDLASTDVKADVFGQYGKKDWECNFLCGALFNPADGRKYLELMVDDASSGSYPGVWKIIISEWKKYALSQLRKTRADDVCFSVDQDMSGGAWGKIAQAVGIKYIAHDLDEGATRPVENLAEGQISLSYDPDDFGAYVNDQGFDSIPVSMIPIHKLSGFEPDSKMKSSDSRRRVKKLIQILAKYHRLDPIYVRRVANGYQILDGHHRFKAYRSSGIKIIPARIIPDRHIVDPVKKNVSETFDQDDSDQDHSNLISIQQVKQNLGRILQAAQRDYDQWDEHDRDTYAGGGICHIIADSICDILSSMGIDSTPVSCSYEQHVYVAARVKEGIYTIDIPYHVYEEGGGFSWRKLPDVRFEPGHVVFYRVSGDPDEWDNYISENFADGRVRGKSRPGRVKRSGASCSGSATDLRARAKKYSGERGRMYHWCANMKSGRR